MAVQFDIGVGSEEPTETAINVAMESVSKPELVSATDPVFEYLVEIIHQGNLTVVGPQISDNACPAVGFVESPVQQALFACRERCCPAGGNTAQIRRQRSLKSDILKKNR